MNDTKKNFFFKNSDYNFLLLLTTIASNYCEAVKTKGHTKR